jgi:hypothetical protein
MIEHLDTLPETEGRDRQIWDVLPSALATPLTAPPHDQRVKVGHDGDVVLIDQ